MVELTEVVARDGVFIVSFFVLIGVGLWLMGGGPTRTRQVPVAAHGAAASRGGFGVLSILRFLGSVLFGMLWVLGAIMKGLSWRLQRYLIERNARRIAKGGPHKNKR